jgi:hypothetical protein
VEGEEVVMSPETLMLLGFRVEEAEACAGLNGFPKVIGSPTKVRVFS